MTIHSTAGLRCQLCNSSHTPLSEITTFVFDNESVVICNYCLKRELLKAKATY